MKVGFYALIAGLGVGAMNLMMGAESTPLPVQPLFEEMLSPSESVKRRTTLFLLEDARVLAESTSARVEPASGEALKDEVLHLERLVVTKKKTPDLPPPIRETRAEEFFRTGTVFEKIGRKTTTRFWARGDKGIMLSFSR